jgi:shikimate dehydrogenase
MAALAPGRYAVIGNPIDHSKSPLIHRAFAGETGQDLEYGRILGGLECFESEVRDFFRGGGRGLNVTVPFKERAWALADSRGPAAEIAGAVNTLSPGDDGRIRGDNTDGVGLIRDLRDNHGFAFGGRRILVLGAGGAVRGVLGPLLVSGIRELVIANRTTSRARALAEAPGPVAVRGIGLDDLAAEAPFDLIINGTSAGLSGATPDLPAGCLAADGWAYDMLYGDAPTPFCRWAQGQGAARALDGLGMLVEQAAESFWLWRGVRPSTAPVIEMLRRLK